MINNQRLTIDAQPSIWSNHQLNLDHPTPRLMVEGVNAKGLMMPCGFFQQFTPWGSPPRPGFKIRLKGVRN